MSNWLPFPTWDGMHPLVVHFPIALLIVSPVFIVLGLIRPDRFRLFSLSALILMFLGTAGAWLAVETGEAAADLVERTPQITAAIAEHQEMAETTRLIFTILTVVYALVLVLPRFAKWIQPRPQTVIHVLFLLVYMGSCLAVARTGHLGARLVHHFGVRAMINDPGAPPLEEKAE
ncbi:hypothetical protein LLG95_06925 [bacterium]|nr:hypothetical protein [bacterium]